MNLNTKYPYSVHLNDCDNDIDVHRRIDWCEKYCVGKYTLFVESFNLNTLESDGFELHNDECCDNGEHSAIDSVEFSFTHPHDQLIFALVWKTI
jgi:hypothetical protein